MGKFIETLLIVGVVCTVWAFINFETAVIGLLTWLVVNTEPREL